MKVLFVFNAHARMHAHSVNLQAHRCWHTLTGDIQVEWLSSLNGVAHHLHLNIPLLCDAFDVCSCVRALGTQSIENAWSGTKSKWQNSTPSWYPSEIVIQERNMVIVSHIQCMYSTLYMNFIGNRVSFSTFDVQLGMKSQFHCGGK